MKFIHDMTGYKVVDIWDMGKDRVMIKLIDNAGDDSPNVLVEVVINSTEKKIRVTPNHPDIKVIVDGHEVNNEPIWQGKSCTVCEKEFKEGQTIIYDFKHGYCTSQKDSEVAQALISYMSDLYSYFGVNNLPKKLTKEFLTKLEALSMSHLNLEHGTLNEDITRMLLLFGEIDGEIKEG